MAKQNKSPKKRSWLGRIFKLFLVLIVLLTVALVAVYIYLGSIVKEAIVRFVPPITGTTVSVADIDLSLLSGRIAVKGLKIGNPKGYSDNNIFELGRIDVAFRPKTVLTEKIIVDSVLISGTKVSAELKNIYSLDSNVGALQQNINRYLGTADKPEKQAQKDDATSAQKSSGKKVVIKDLQIRNTELALGVSGNTISIGLPDIQQKDIGEAKKEKSIAEMMADILDLISLESLKSIPQAAADLSKQAARFATDIVQKTAKGASDLVSSGAGAVSDGAKSAVDGIKGLFK